MIHVSQNEGMDLKSGTHDSLKLHMKTGKTIESQSI